MRLGLPKGRLLEGVLGRLERAGVTFHFDSDRHYKPASNEPAISAKLFKARAIPQLLALGNIDLGFTGLDLVAEAGYEQIVDLLDLGLNRVELVVAVARAERDLLESPPRRPVVIATEYEQLAARWAMEHRLAHIAIQTHGSTEAYLPEDADIIFDCTETGATLAANDLVIIDRLMVSTTHLFANRRALESNPAVEELAARLEP
jgi:ATP phosphoribosyltransferase